MSGLGITRPDRLQPNFMEAHAILFRKEPPNFNGTLQIREVREDVFTQTAQDGLAVARFIVAAGADQSVEMFVVIAGVESRVLHSSDAWRGLRQSLMEFADGSEPLHFVGLASVVAEERHCFAGRIDANIGRIGPFISPERGVTDYTVVNLYNALPDSAAHVTKQRVVVKHNGSRLFWRDEGVWVPLYALPEFEELLGQRPFLGMIPDPAGDDLLVCSNLEGDAVFGRLIRRKEYSNFVDLVRFGNAIKLSGAVRGARADAAGKLCVVAHEIVDGPRATRVQLVPVNDVWRLILREPAA